MSKNKFVSGVGHIFNPTPDNDEEVLQHGNSMAASGNYPVGTDACFNVGISGGCGINCFVVNGQSSKYSCPEPDEFYDQIKLGKYDKGLSDFDDENCENDKLVEAINNRLQVLGGAK